MKKWMVILILIFALLLGFPNRAIAAETTESDAVYVAGNPDLFPFEYYDTRTKSYQGILPELYKQISQATGLEFVYIHPGMINQQNRLAKNKQVELVSAHIQGEIETAERALVLLQYDGNTEICVAFTAIAPEWVEETIRSSLENLSAQQVLELSLRVPEPHPEQKLYWLAGIIGGILLLIIAVLVAVLLWHRKTRKENNKIQFIDPLTGIGNQSYFVNTFQHCITPANYALYYLSYISLDVQRIEQYLGGVKAEEIQRYAADVLSHAAAEEDFAARIGDGVFLLAFQAPSEEAATTRVTEILNQLNQYEGSFLEENRVLFHAGVFWIDAANLSVETAVFNARQGYNAAVHNQCSYIFADKALLNRERTKIELQRKLLGALENHEFQLYMQMIVDQNEKIIGAEALTRWQSREKGLLSPGVFIESLKSAGLIDKLDFYILEEVCKQLEQWNRTGKGHLWISCNFTRLTVSRSDFIERFRAVLARYQFSPGCLIIELTEDSLMDNTTVAYRNILECKKMGCKIALDDLGSGYSSLQDLCDYPIDIIKIDRHILLKSTAPRGNALLQGLTKLGHDLGIKVLCEGVESETEKKRVCEAGCDYIQGFYYSRVLPREEADLFYLRKQNH
jgi:EAL domain-containing protein (putative c-di-GMP-specific phosphodiesterase class I)